LSAKKGRNQSDRIILGIDPGTGRSGWALLQLKVESEKFPPKADQPRAEKVDKGVVLVACGLIETKPKTPLPERLLHIYKEVKSLIEKYCPTELAIEEIFFVKNIKTGISVAHARGVVVLAAKEAGLEINEYKPNEIKMAIVGYGHADKPQMAKMVKLHLKGCTIEQDDVVDAIAVALCHLQSKKIFK